MQKTLRNKVLPTISFLFSYYKLRKILNKKRITCLRKPEMFVGNIIAHDNCTTWFLLHCYNLMLELKQLHNLKPLPWHHCTLNSHNLIFTAFSKLDLSFLDLHNPKSLWLRWSDIFYATPAQPDFHYTHKA